MKKRVPLAIDFPLYMEVKSITPCSCGMLDVELSGINGSFKTSFHSVDFEGLSVGSVVLVRMSLFPLIDGLDFIPYWLEAK